MGAHGCSLAPPVLSQAIESAIGGNAYQHSKVNQWTTNVVEQTLSQLTKLGKPFKYIGNGRLLLAHARRRGSFLTMGQRGCPPLCRAVGQWRGPSEQPLGERAGRPPALVPAVRELRASEQSSGPAADRAVWFQ